MGSSKPLRAAKDARDDRRSVVKYWSSSLRSKKETITYYSKHQQGCAAAEAGRHGFPHFDRYDLRPDALVVLKANADWLKAHPSVRVEIERHARYPLDHTK